MRVFTAFILLLCAANVWALPQQDDQQPSLKFESVEQELTAYYFAAARTNNVAVLEQFVESGFPVDVVNGKGYTALMVATYHGNAEAFDYLMSKNANSCAVDMRGNTALMAAIFRGELSLARKLMAADCDESHPNNAGNTAIDFAERFGRSDLQRDLLAINN